MMPNSARKAVTVGEIVNLISVDCQRLQVKTPVIKSQQMSCRNRSGKEQGLLSMHSNGIIAHDMVHGIIVMELQSMLGKFEKKLH